jgi:hypothetical protein
LISLSSAFFIVCARTDSFSISLVFPSTMILCDFMNAYFNSTKLGSRPSVSARAHTYWWLLMDPRARRKILSLLSLCT